MLAPVHPLHMAMGLIIWSLFFIAIYAGLSVACSLAPPAAALGPMTWINALLLALTLLTCALLLFSAWRCRRSPVSPGNRHFVARVSTGVYLIAAAATLAVGLPVIILPPCI